MTTGREAILYLFPICLLLLFASGYDFQDMFWNGLILLFTSFSLHIVFSVNPQRYMEKHENISLDMSKNYSRQEWKEIMQEFDRLLSLERPGLHFFNKVLNICLFLTFVLSILMMISGVMAKLGYA